MGVPGDERTIEQLTKQLYKLVNILKVQDITNTPCVERELMLLKVKATKETRTEILEIVKIFRARVVDLSDHSLTIEITGNPGKMAAIEKMVSKFGITEIARTGKIALVREASYNLDTKEISIN